MYREFICEQSGNCEQSEQKLWATCEWASKIAFLRHKATYSPKNRLCHTYSPKNMHHIFTSFPPYWKKKWQFGYLSLLTSFGWFTISSGQFATDWRFYSDNDWKYHLEYIFPCIDFLNATTCLSTHYYRGSESYQMVFVLFYVYFCCIWLITCLGKRCWQYRLCLKQLFVVEA